MLASRPSLIRYVIDLKIGLHSYISINIPTIYYLVQEKLIYGSLKRKRRLRLVMSTQWPLLFITYNSKLWSQVMMVVSLLFGILKMES
jgi:hypothetical protein